MQLNKLSPLAVAILAALLSACGGGGDDAPPPPPAAAPPAIKVSAVTLHSSTPTAYTGDAVQFDGGVCSDGTGTLTQTWDFGDTPAASAINTPNPTHTYSTEGTKTVKVTCTDSAGTKAQTASKAITVLAAAKKGFLGKTWTTYSAIDASNISPYPVAGLATSGDIYGVWLREDALTGKVEAAAGTTNRSSTSWTAPVVFNTGSAESPYDATAYGGSTAAIDVAVSPNGRAMAAWLAGSSIWYATKGVTGAWSTPTEITGETVKNDASASIKVVVNDAGNAAIAYCKSDTDARVITVSSGTHQSSQPISKHCGVLDSPFLAILGYQRHRAFDIAIENTSTSTVYAVGVGSGTLDTNKSAVRVQTYTPGGSLTDDKAISAEIDTTALPGSLSFKSLSFSRSPNGNYSMVAWNQGATENGINLSHVYTNIKVGTGNWATTAVHLQGHVPTRDYSRPMVAINDTGHAFLAARYTINNISTVEAFNSTASTGWSIPTSVSASAPSAMDVAIDNWGTGLITRFDNNESQAGTFALASGPTQWSGFKTLSPKYPTSLSASALRYQTMRALPDGHAILVTAVYDGTTVGTPVSSGYVLLK